MIARRHRPIPRPHAQRGLTMLEVLVTLLIIALWLLGTAGAQSSAVKLTKAAQFRTSAVFLASEIAERMEANGPAAKTGAYACAADACLTGSASTCVGTACSSDALAAFDLTEWGARVAAALPSATATIAFAAPVYTITLGWTDRGDSRTTGTTEALTYTATKTVNQN
jgi:type IV pilus assembly protein PilV